MDGLRKAEDRMARRSKVMRPGNLFIGVRLHNTRGQPSEQVHIPMSRHISLKTRNRSHQARHGKTYAPLKAWIPVPWTRAPCTLAASTRSGLMALMYLPSREAVMVGVAVLSSAACCTVHLPAHHPTTKKAAGSGIYQLSAAAAAAAFLLPRLRAHNVANHRNSKVWDVGSTGSRARVTAGCRCSALKQAQQFGSVNLHPCCRHQQVPQGQGEASFATGVHQPSEPCCCLA
eukprot:1150783-Pelagomonas_calceolata.AAC.3